jgi:hypothetical protein
VNRTEQQAKQPFRRIGLLGALEACLRGGESSGAPRSRRHTTDFVRAAAAVLTVAMVAVFSAGIARAADTHLPLFQLGEIPVEGPHGEAVALPGPLEKMESMTIDSGHLWVAEEISATQSRIDEFDAANGTFIAQPVHVEAKTPDGEGYGENYGTGIAVGHGPGEPAVYVGGRIGAKQIVSVFNEAGVLKKNWTGASTPGGSFGGNVSGVAVDNSTDPLDEGQGDVYVAIGSEGVIDVFHPETNGEEHYVGQIAGTSPSEPFLNLLMVAVDQATGELVVRNGQRNEEPQPGKPQLAVQIDVLKPGGLGTYELAHKITGLPGATFGELYTLAVDSGSGEIYVTEFPKERPYRIDQFSATGSYLGQIENVAALDPYAIAVDPTSHDLYARSEVFGPNIVIPDVTTAAASNVDPESVTLNGTVNPDGAGAATCEFEWGTSTSFGRVAPCSKEVPDGESPVSVQVSLGGLERDTTYYYRLRASNANGTNSGESWQDEQFSTYGLILREGFVTNVAATSATFGARIDPGETPTSYYFQYGTSSEYGQDTPAPPGNAIGSGSVDVEVPSLEVRGLTPGTVYHYRVVAIGEIAPGVHETIDGEDHTFTTQATGGSFTPADGRQWELVSPANKLGSLIEGFGHGGRPAGVMQASAEGGAIAYRASLPTESEPHGGYAKTETVLSTRGTRGWSSQDISPSHDHPLNTVQSVGNEFQIFSEDLSRAALQPADSSLTLLSPEASESTAYLRTDFLGGNVEDRCTSSCYRPFVTGEAGFANIPSGTVFGEEPKGRCEAAGCGPRFRGASPDLSHVVLSSPAQLTSTPASAGGPGLYEWSEGSLQLLDVLPHGEEGPAVLAGAGDELGVRHSISDDGERIVLEGGAKGGEGLYLRDTATEETIRLDVPQGGSGPSEGVSYMDASDDASRIFFLDRGKLMADSSPSGEDLYEYDLNAPVGSRLSDLTADPHTGQAADVAMMLGASEDGSYVYFAAAGALALGAVEGECAGGLTINSSGRSCNLYVRHEDVTRLVAVLPSYEGQDWSRMLHENPGLFARVSPDGRWLAFMSAAELTGYDTHDAVSRQPDLEVYLFHAPAGAGEAGALICASCDPTGARPVGELGVKKTEDDEKFNNRWVAASVAPWTGFPDPKDYNFSFAVHQPRYLLDSGRLFFDSTDALVPQDVDGTEDVYEYEPEGVPAGEHACANASASGSVVFRPARAFEIEGRAGEEGAGCVGLISSGTSSESSSFLDASETGGDVFFLTQARLAPQDDDTAFDVYDAHECTSSSLCTTPVTPPPPCETEASCKPAPELQPSLYGAPSSATFSGVGNIGPGASLSSPVKKTVEKTAKCPKGETRNKHEKCVKAKTKRKKPKAKAKKSVHSDRRASR